MNISKTQQRAFELCAVIESELETMDGTHARSPELVRVAGYLDELRLLIKELDPHAVGGKVSPVGSAVWRVVTKVSLELIKILTDSQKYEQTVRRAATIDHGRTQIRYGDQEASWSRGAIPEGARAAA